MQEVLDQYQLVIEENKATLRARKSADSNDIPDSYIKQINGIKDRITEKNYLVIEVDHDDEFLYLTYSSA